MLPDGATAVAGEWVTQQDLAQLKGVSRQAISKRWKRYRDEGLIEVRKRGRFELVQLAKWDSVAREVTDPSRFVQAGGQADGADVAEDDGPQSDPSYLHERTRAARYMADLREIELRRVQGDLVDAGAVAAAMALCGERLGREIDQVPSAADDLVAAMTRGGGAAVREELKILARRLRGTLEANLRLLASDASADPAPPAALSGGSPFDGRQIQNAAGGGDDGGAAAPSPPRSA